LHDDMFDALARIADNEGRRNGDSMNLSLVWPMPDEDPNKPVDRYARRERRPRNAWAA
jgi:hypothetical protein